MGSLWRNRELRRCLGAILLAGAVALPVCFALHPGAGLAAAALFVVQLGLFWGLTHRRYRQIARLCDQLAKAGAGEYVIDIREYAEGELSILSGELLKLTSALSHQAGALRRDKQFLADSLADISHQLRTPLTSLSVLTELLEDEHLPEQKRREFLAGMRTGLDRIRWLIEALLKLSRLDAGAVTFQWERTTLAAVAERAAAPLRIPVELLGQTLTVLAEEDVSLETDPRWLAEAVGNLLKNCVEHTGEGGRITLGCTRTALYSQLCVWDDGPGIPEAELPRVFERFYRGKNAAADSVGIGLALSKSIVRNLGGTLSAANRPQGGACFTVRLYGKPGGSSPGD